jgi:thymidylate synthase
MTTNAYATLADAYIGGIRSVLSNGRKVPPIKDASSVASGFGSSARPSLEIAPFLSTTLDPSNALIWSTVRGIRVSYCLGLLLWTLAGSNSLGWVEYYNGRAAAFSDHGRILSGSFGHRLAVRRADQTQIDRIVERLSLDPFSRRAVAAIYGPADLLANSRDTPCAIAVQYLLRDDALESTVFMRSQSAALVLVYDAFLFATLQRLIAARLGVRLGPMHLAAGSFHVYEDEVDLAHRITLSPVQSVGLGPISPRQSDLDKLLEFERAVRLTRSAKSLHEIGRRMPAAFAPDTFEAEAQRILLAFALIKCGDPRAARETLDPLRPTLRAVALSEFSREG